MKTLPTQSYGLGLEEQSLLFLEGFVSMTLLKGFILMTFFDTFERAYFYDTFERVEKKRRSRFPAHESDWEGATEGHRWGEKDMPFHFKEKN